LPPGAPIAASAEAPILPPIFGALLVLFVIGIGAQLLAMRRGAI
jgi:hypothetical protein